MSSNRLKAILKEPTIGLYEDIGSSGRVVSKAEHLFDQLVGNKTKKCDTYSGRVRKPFTKLDTNVATNHATIDSSLSDECQQNDCDFEPSAKTSKTRVKNRQNKVKFVDISGKRVAKKGHKKCKELPHCTKEALLMAFESAGLPDYDEIARHELHVTKAKDYVKADPPTPPMADLLRPFADLVDWSEVDFESEVVQNDDTIHSQGMALPESETNCSQTSDSVIDSVRKRTKDHTNSVSNKTFANRRSERRTRLEFRGDELTTAALGGARIASTPVVRKHNVTIKNISPIQTIDSPEVDVNSKVADSGHTFVEPLQPTKRNLRTVPKVSTLASNVALVIVEPSINDLQKVTVGEDRSKRITRSLIDASVADCVETDDNNQESNTLVANGQSGSHSHNSNPFVPLKGGNHRINSRINSFNELSMIFDPIIKSTPLVTSKRNEWKNSKYELVVDRTHFDASISKMCRSMSDSQILDVPLKTTTIVPVIDSDSESVISTTTAQKRTTRKSNAYKLYRQSIHSVHEMYHKSHQPFRTVIRDDEYCLDSIQIIRTGLKCKEDLRQFLDNTLSQTMFSTSKVVFEGKQTVLTTKQKVLLMCDPNEVIDFRHAFEEIVLQTIRKIGEGSYGEVFGANDSAGRECVIKVIPLVNSGTQCEEDLFAQILPEIVISKEFNRLKSGLIVNRAPNFIDMLRVSTARGVFPSKLIKAWDVFNAEKGSENDNPRDYSTEQLYVILQLGNGGTDFESFNFKSALESLSVFAQLSLALAAAEQEYEFEHRDMHWGNILVNHTNAERLEYTVNGVHYSLCPNGVFTSLIDFSLSRMSNNGFIIFDDLAKYNDLFEGTGDHQFEVYRLMREHNENDWQKFSPKTNIFWLYYMLQKAIKSKKYSSKSKVHKNAIQLMKGIFKDIHRFDSATHLVQSEEFVNYLSHLDCR